MTEHPTSIPQRLVLRSQRAISQVVGDEMILLDPGTENFIALNDVGAHIWGLLAEEPQTERLRDLVAAEYGISGDEASKDLDEFVDRLAELGLVSWTIAP